MNPDQDHLQTSVKMLKENWRNAILPKVLENKYLTTTIYNLKKDRKNE